MKDNILVYSVSEKKQMCKTTCRKMKKKKRNILYFRCLDIYNMDDNIHK